MPGAGQVAGVLLAMDIGAYDAASRHSAGPGEAVAVAIQLLSPLEHAHAAGVLHLDLKPQNVYLCDDGPVKILDLGLAQLDLSPTEASDGSPGGAARGAATAEQSPLTGGTPAYMAPEQWRREGLDERTDLWPVGVILFVALAGRAPFRAAHRKREVMRPQPAPALEEVAPGAPVEPARVVARALAKDRAGRYPSAAEMREALENVQAGAARAAASAEGRTAPRDESSVPAWVRAATSAGGCCRNLRVGWWLLASFLIALWATVARRTEIVTGPGATSTPASAAQQTKSASVSDLLLAALLSASAEAEEETPECDLPTAPRATRSPARGPAPELPEKRGVRGGADESRFDGAAATPAVESQPPWRRGGARYATVQWSIVSAGALPPRLR